MITMVPGKVYRRVKLHGSVQTLQNQTKNGAKFAVTKEVGNLRLVHPPEKYSKLSRQHLFLLHEARIKAFGKAAR